VASASNDGTARIWTAGSGAVDVPLADYDPQIDKTQVFSPDGKLFATGGTDGTLKVWYAATGQPVAKSQTGHDGIVGLAFSPDGRIAGANEDQHRAGLECHDGPIDRDHDGAHPASPKCGI
jgi:WD40 repeat protein